MFDLCFFLVTKQFINIGNAKLVLDWLDRDPDEATFQYIDFVSGWLFNVVMEKSVEHFLDLLLKVREVEDPPPASVMPDGSLPV